MASNKELFETSAFFSTNIAFINELYQKFIEDSSAVDDSWGEFFTQNKEEVELILADYRGPSWAQRDVGVVGSEKFDISTFKKEVEKKSSLKKLDSKVGKDLKLHILNLITDYKRFGHLVADLDPLGLSEKGFVKQLKPEFHGIESADLEKEVEMEGLLGLQRAKVSQVISRIKEIYASKVGAHFEYINDEEQKNWLAAEFENAMVSDFSSTQKKKMLKEIIRTEKFEQFLHKRFPGAKRFSIEGADSAISSVEHIVEVSAKNGVKKIIIGMAHRGRLNTLTGVMDKPYHQMLSEFQGTPGISKDHTKSGDVKYHMGYSTSREIEGNKVELSLAFNPSHLEAVNPVVAGRVRAHQDHFNDSARHQALGILIHGDAAFAGQGSVVENLVMNGLAGYETGGMIHLIINNQVGFTANPTDSRSTKYASDLAKGVDAPIFHVNADDVEAVARVSEIVTNYRKKFKKDIVIDLIGYRRYGHNEGDEPMYTQPVMYTKIKKHPTVEKIYSSKLVAEGSISGDDHKAMLKEFEDHLIKEFDIAKDYKPKDADWLKSYWKGVANGDNKLPSTKVAAKKLKEYVARTTKIPADFNANKKIVKQLEARKALVDEGKNIDWGVAENLAFSSLLDEGYPIRITGQDSGRGTFSHRHCVLHDNTNGNRHNVFEDFKESFEVHDSVLSEYGVLGFEYGYSLSTPNGLTIWEAQFGDFANGAQIIFDQFIASSEVKWLRKSNLVMLLPHGYEGQGPEHSSARLERYLQACADNNLRVVNITNPANFFHALRRQLHSKDRKPLVVMTPKSLLRHKLATSNIKEFSDNNFQTVIPEHEKLVANDKVKKVVLCSGKVYYDLVEAREEKKIKDVAIIRVEQLYPFPKEEIKAELKKYKNAQVIWTQEEPKNMGAWKFVDDLFEETLVEIKHKNARAKYVGRVASASPATGYLSYHLVEQKKLIDESLK